MLYEWIRKGNAKADAGRKVLLKRLRYQCTKEFSRKLTLPSPFRLLSAVLQNDL